MATVTQIPFSFFSSLKPPAPRDFHPPILSNPTVRGGVGSYGSFAKIFAVLFVVLIAIPCVVVGKHMYRWIRGKKDRVESIRDRLGENRLAALRRVSLDYETIRATLNVSIVRPQDILMGSTVTALAVEGKNCRDLQRFLLQKKTFGTDPNSPSFRQGFRSVQFHRGSLHDENLIETFRKMQSAIDNAPSERLELYLQKEVRERLDSLLQSNTYQFLAASEGRKHPFVRALQDVSLAIRLDSHGAEEFYSLGDHYFRLVELSRGPMQRGKEVACLANALDDIIGTHHWGYKIESLADKLLVWSRYPDKTYMAAKSHQPMTALDYNSYQVGNQDMAYGDYSLQKMPIRAIHGPTPTSDHLLLGQIEGQRAVGGIHLQHNLEHPGFSTGDLIRTEYLLSVEKQYPATFRLLSTPLDGVSWRLPGEKGKYFLDYSSVEEFFLKYGTFAFANRCNDPAPSFDALQGKAHRAVEGRGDNGFYLGDKVMSDDQLRSAFVHATQAFSHVDPSREDKRRLTRALQVGVQGFIAVGAMVQALKDAYPEASNAEIEQEVCRASFGQACKLDIDRGVVLNVMTRVYFQLAAGKELTRDDLCELIGAVVGRAELASGRTIIFDRYQPLSDALRLIGENQQQVQLSLQSYLASNFNVTPEKLDYKSSS